MPAVGSRAPANHAGGDTGSGEIQRFAGRSSDSSCSTGSAWEHPLFAAPPRFPHGHSQTRQSRKANGYQAGAWEPGENCTTSIRRAKSILNADAGTGTDQIRVRRRWRVPHRALHAIQRIWQYLQTFLRYFRTAVEAFHGYSLLPSQRAAGDLNCPKPS